LISYFPLLDVEEAGDGEEALSKVEYRRPDIIFMDIQLPGENGLEVTKKIKQVYKDIVIVILSSRTLPEYRQQAFRHGADCFISLEEDTYMDAILARVEAEIAG
jgi:CheY-like chemotaxis protein